ncbi:hypothetical protein QQ045_029807 [Rhodiola kirilowii]
MAQDLDEFVPISADEGKLSADDNILQFLDSVDDYLTMMGSLSSTLSQGWMELASARHSMGASRVSSALFDLKSHSAVTTLQLGQSYGNQPHFGLHKWGFHETGAKQLNDDEQYTKGDTPQLRRRGSTEVSVAQDSTKAESPAVNIQVQKERAKSLSVFGTLVSPKLRSSQLSFETALDTLVLLANRRSSLLHSADNVRKEMERIRH